MAKLPTGISTTAVREVKPPPFQLSPQQLEIRAHGQIPGRNLLVRARAGTGKTSTMIELSKQLSNGIYLAFNKSIASEVSFKLAEAGIGKDVQAKTFHAVGMQAWMKHARARVEPEKLSILADLLRIPNAYQPFVKKLVELAKQNLVGAVPDLPIDDDAEYLQIIDHFDLLDLMPQGEADFDEDEFISTGIEWALRLLQRSNLESQVMIDFTDMLYMPLYAMLRFWQYENVIIDEAQDTNRARREIALRLLAPTGKLIAVGDEHQAIYGFTGADSDAMDLIQRDFGCDELPLTVTRRCPKKVVELAQRWVPDIEAPADAPEGVCSVIDERTFSQIVPDATDAILCRNMRPLARIAYGYLRKKIPCYIEGRELGSSLIGLIKRWRSVTSLLALEEKLTEYLETETAKLTAKRQTGKIALLVDRVDTLRVLMEDLPNDAPVSELISLINSMFKDGDGMPRQITVLSTIHKAKGREWDRVFLLGRNLLMPSPYAKQEWQLTQEDNLAYVAVTRAKSQLIEVLLTA